MKKQFSYLPIVLLVVLFAVVVFAAMLMRPNVRTNITSFSSCAQAGYPIMESYPRQCKTPDGRSFTENISQPINVAPSLPGGNGSCVNHCGDGTCAEIVCQAIGCPCAETAATCPQDCKAN